MKRAGLLAIALLVCACSSGGQPIGTTPASTTSAAGRTPAGAASAGGQTSASSTQAITGGGGAGGSLLDKAKAVQGHFCTLLPTDLVPGIIDKPSPPQEEQFPPRCSVYGDKTAMEFALDAVIALGDPPAGAKTISGLGTGAYLENLTPTNFYLSVGLSPEGGVLHVEVNNGDGKDHTDQVVNLAKAILQRLGG
jgi:hypothetical protein